MALTIFVALATATAAPAQKPHAPVARPPLTATIPKAPPVDPMAAIAMLNKMMDKFFPAGPEPDPARLAAARGAVQTMFPNGAYAEAMTGFMDKMIEGGLNMSEADFADLAPATKPKKKAATPSTIPFRQQLSAKEPNFDAKLAAVRAFMGKMMDKVGAASEPALRDGIARSLARKFDVAQIGEINGFLATPTGQRYGREMVGLWFEPDVMRGAMAVMPQMMKMMPDMIQDFTALDAQMKALGKSKASDAKTTD